jgi:hypothetical protein
MAAFVAATGTAWAQTTSPDEGRIYAEFTAAATLGNKSDKSVGFEAGYLVTRSWEVFVEGGRLGNVGTDDLDARAQKIANFIGGSSSAVQKATFFAVGVKYVFPAVIDTFRPYIGFAAGAAKIKTEVNFVVGGTDVTSQLSAGIPSLGIPAIELGNDLTDSLTKSFITIPIGIRGTFLKRYVVDGSYRWGRIGPRPEDIDADVPITAQRVQIGIGIRF